MKMRGTGKRSAAPRQEEGGCETEREMETCTGDDAHA